MKKTIFLITTLLSICAIQAFAADRYISIVGKYICLPVKYDADNVLISLQIEDIKVREFMIELAPDEPDYWVYLEVQDFIGKKGRLNAWEVSDKQIKGFESIYSADTFPGESVLYKEELRPQFHFSSKRGWNNDPNGMMYYDGEYHLFYQHNPFGWNWGNMTWGHAISTDMVHWVEQGDKLHADEFGTMYSGSGVVDWNNTTGFQTGDEPPLVLIYTIAGNNSRWSEGKPFTQGLAYSNDRGRTWTKYRGNPVQSRLRKGNRDPKVFWWEPTKEWAIVMFLSEGQVAFFTSPNLKRWELHSMMNTDRDECPELIQLTVDGDKENKKWVHYSAHGEYYIGEFDGKEFTKETGSIRYSYGNCFYASQTFNDIPEDDGRVIQIGWGTVNLPDMPFNQMMTFPVSLSLRSTDDGLRMFAYPVEEIKNIHGTKHVWNDKKLKPGQNPLENVKGNLFDINVDIELGDAEEVGFEINGFPVSYNVKEKLLTGGDGKGGHYFSSGDTNAELKPIDGKISLRILVDRPSLEVFANEGRIYMPLRAVRDLNNETLKIYSKGGNAQIRELTVYEIEPTWPPVVPGH